MAGTAGTPFKLRSNAPCLTSSFWSADTTIFLKQAAAVGLFHSMKGCFTTGGGVHDSLKKSFTPEGLILGYNSMYFHDAQASPLLKEFVRDYKLGFYHLSSFRCSDLGCWVYYENTLPSPPRSEH